MPLPQLTKESDVEAICSYLNSYPNGITITEAMTSMPRQIFDPQKINAYVVWGFVDKTGDLLKLTPLGSDLINIAPGHMYLIYQKVIFNLEPYRSAVGWMFQKDFSEITNIEIATYWQLNFKAYLGTSDENQMKSMATCFLQICQAAGFGTLSSGRSSGMNRFGISKSALGRFFTETVHIMETQAAEESGIGSIPVPAVEVPETAQKPQPGADVERFEHFKDRFSAMAEPAPAAETRIYISPTANKKLSEQIITMLEVEKYNYMVGAGDLTKGLVPGEDAAKAMKKCNAAVIILGADEKSKLPGGMYAATAESLMELGAAMVLIGKNVILLYDDRVEVPQTLQSMQSYEFSGAELSWNTGVALMNSVKAFLQK